MRVRLWLTLLLWVVGITPLLWWNGQFFTNRIMSSTCYLGCLVMWLPMLAQRRPRQARITAAVLVVVNAVVLIAGITGLPASLEKQRKFNQALEDVSAQQLGPAMTPVPGPTPGSGMNSAEFELEPCELRLSPIGRRANFQGTVRLDLETNSLGRPTKVTVPSGQTLALFLEVQPIKECVARWLLAANTKYELRVRFGTHDPFEKWSLSLVNPGCPTITLPPRSP